MTPLLSDGQSREWKSGIPWPEPKVVDPGPVGGPPADAIVLFDSKDLSQWHGGQKWIVQDGYAIARGGGITSKQAFGAQSDSLSFPFSISTGCRGWCFAWGRSRPISGAQNSGKWRSTSRSAISFLLSAIIPSLPVVRPSIPVR